MFLHRQCLVCSLVSLPANTVLSYTGRLFQDCCRWAAVEMAALLSDYTVISELFQLLELIRNKMHIWMGAHLGFKRYVHWQVLTIPRKRKVFQQNIYPLSSPPPPPTSSRFYLSNYVWKFNERGHYFQGESGRREILCGVRAYSGLNVWVDNNMWQKHMKCVWNEVAYCMLTG